MYNNKTTLTLTKLTSHNTLTETGSFAETLAVEGIPLRFDECICVRLSLV